MKRHAAYGRLSELFGSAALDFDIGMRKINLLAGARKDLAALSKRELAVLQNHADGINHFATTKWLPIEFSIMGVKFSEWTPLDTCLLIKLMYLSTSYNWAEELFREYVAYHLQNSTLASQIFPVHESLMSEDDVYIVADHELGERYFERDHTYKEKALLAVAEKYKKPKKQRAVKPELEPHFNLAPAGSNSFVISGKHTKSGKPIAAFDPHLPTELPS